MGLIDSTLKGKFSVDEASRYIRIALLCTQDTPNNRPSMSTVVNMLTGYTDVDEKSILKPCLLTELSMTDICTPDELSTKSGKPIDAFFSSNETMSHGTMTFTSIGNRCH